jgi:glycosyltransferase involved in cell wall biosynthesis
MSPQPKVSVIVPTFNRRVLLARALASVRAQTFTDFEVVVVDDGSTDGTAEALAAEPPDRLRCIRLDRNLGQSAARNIGLRAAHGRLLAFLDSDDEWMPEKLAHQVAQLESQPGLAMVYGDLLRVPLRGPTRVLAAPDLVRGRIMDGRSSGYASYGLGIQTCLIRAEVMQDLGGFNEQLHCFEDLEFFLRLNRRYAAQRTAEPWARYYETEGVSRQSRNEYAARSFLLRTYWWTILRQRPSWLWKEHANIRHRRRLDP